MRVGRLELGFASVWLFSRETRAIVGFLEIPSGLADARRVLARPPTIEHHEIISWGSVTREELERLLAAAEPGDAEAHRLELDALPLDLASCSFCYPGAR